MNELKSLKYFSGTLLDPMFELFEILDNENHPEHQNVLFDLKFLDSNALTEFVFKSPIDEMIGRNEDKDTSRRAYFLINILQNQINVYRKSKLTEVTERQVPYNSQNFLGVKINHYGLKVHSFETD